jgi:hypothetical protein
VLMPNAAPIPKIRIKIARGTNPGGGGPFFLSVRANTAIRSTAVPKNYWMVITQEGKRASRDLLHRRMPRL